MDKIEHKTHWERFKGVITALFSDDLASGIMMVSAVVIALILANSGWATEFHEFWEYSINLSVNDAELSITLHQFVNDGLMAIFFFAIGLEIKREIIAGELSSLRTALMPIICALGGLIFPVLVFMLINNGQDTFAGWGIPMATDIVFALILLTLVGNKKVPIALKIFVTALAVVDDICAVLVIAFFYTDHIVYESLLWAFLSFFVLIGANGLGVKNPLFYGVIGILGIWTGFFLSGVHATIAGVITAIAIPARVDLEERTFVKNVRNLIDSFDTIRTTETVFMKNDKLELVHILRKAIRKTVPPLQTIERILQPFVNFFVLPLFALANTGLTIETENLGKLLEPLSVGVVLGLVLGKFLGISIVARLAAALKIAKLPEKVQWPQFYGAAAFAGIGFTMSIFIAELAFANEAFVHQAKLAILLAFILAALLGMFIFRFFVKTNQD
ncbi:MAG: Na+/H+ antiporter NhaA [Maribacter litoralis]|uniref:Na+/H+ antiporter NhaA n=1 Tax=Maribacter litoralis TaxID=2059726 RepID=UPI00329A16D9